MSALDGTASRQGGDFPSPSPLRVWGGNGAVAEQVDNAQNFVLQLEAAWGNAVAQQIQSGMAAAALVAWSMQDLFRSAGPLDLVATESNILNTLARAASWQTHAWGEFAEKAQQCCLMTTRNAMDEFWNLAHAAA